MTTLTQRFANNAVSLLAAPIDSTSTALEVISGHGALFPNPGANEYFLVTLEDQTGSRREIIRVRSRVDDTFLFDLSDRGQEGTIAQAWDATLGNDTLVDHRVTAGTMDRAVPVPSQDIHGASTITPVPVLSGAYGTIDRASYGVYQRGFKFFVTLYQPATFLSCTFEVLGNISGDLAANDEQVSWIRSTRVGANLHGDIQIDLDKNTKELVLTWRNDEAQSTEVMCTRIQHLP